MFKAVFHINDKANSLPPTAIARILKGVDHGNATCRLLEGGAISLEADFLGLSDLVELKRRLGSKRNRRHTTVSVVQVQEVTSHA